MPSSNTAIAIFSVLLLKAKAAIVEDGIWTGEDWYDEVSNIGVSNGVPYSNDLSVQRRISAPKSIDGSIDDIYLTLPNVVRVQSLFSEADWDDVFPLADAIYTYDNFLKAVGKFPYFCDQTNISGQSLDDTCKRELSSIFAHWGQETGKRSPGEGDFWQQALFYVEEIRCKDTSDPSCDYKSAGWADEAWPSQPGQQYYGRGPFQLSWNYNYGQFSNIFAPSAYDSKLFLLQNPDLVHEDGFLAMAAGIWFYMTPQDPKPSMHDVMTGFFEPNATDLALNITASFGTTINIINGGVECGQVPENSKAASRGEYYLEWLNFFDMPAEGDLGCSSQASYFPYAGAGDQPGYWAQDWSGTIKACKPAGYQTPYSISARDDYKRCVCDLFGEGAADCPSDGNTVPYNPDDFMPYPLPPPTPEEPEVNPWETFQELEEIRANPNYSPEEYSRTLYQVERELDFLEAKMLEIFQAADAAGILTN